LWPVDLMQKLYRSGLTCKAVAAKLRTVSDKTGKTYRVRSAAVRRVLLDNDCEMRNIGAAAGERNGNWKGGKTTSRGYVFVHRPDHPHAKANGYVPEHRLVAERVLGRYLLPGEVVHHEDEDPSNNDPSNLVLYPNNATHLKETRKGRKPNWSKDGYKRVLRGLENARRIQNDAKKCKPKLLGIKLG